MTKLSVEMQHLKDTAIYCAEFALPMRPAPSDEEKAARFPTLTLFPKEFKTGFISIQKAMRAANHPDVEIFWDYSETDIFGGFYGNATAEEDREDQDREKYLHYMVNALTQNPEQRFIEYEKKSEWNCPPREE